MPEETRKANQLNSRPRRILWQVAEVLPETHARTASENYRDHVLNIMKTGSGRYWFHVTSTAGKELAVGMNELTESIARDNGRRAIDKLVDV